MNQGFLSCQHVFFMIFQKQLYKNMPDTDINNFVKAFLIKYNSVILLHPHVLLNKKPWSRTFLSFKTVSKHKKIYKLFNLSPKIFENE